jgi:hypothetical protein
VPRASRVRRLRFFFIGGRIWFRDKKAERPCDRSAFSEELRTWWES